nr:hypothetical protein [Candidatus Njordarchaeota archaeon]
MAMRGVAERGSKAPPQSRKNLQQTRAHTVKHNEAETLSNFIDTYRDLLQQPVKHEQG